MVQCAKSSSTLPLKGTACSCLHFNYSSHPERAYVERKREDEPKPVPQTMHVAAEEEPHPRRSRRARHAPQRHLARGARPIMIVSNRCFPDRMIVISGSSWVSGTDKRTRNAAGAYGKRKKHKANADSGQRAHVHRRGVARRALMAAAHYMRGRCEGCRAYIGKCARVRLHLCKSIPWVVIYNECTVGRDLGEIILLHVIVEGSAKHGSSCLHVWSACVYYY